MADAKQVHLNLFVHRVGHHEAAWRAPESRPESVVDIDYYQQVAVMAEAAKFDSYFLADTLSTGMFDVRRNLVSVLDPFAILAAVAPLTSRIGLIATASTSYNEPFNVARRYASLDHISHGRAGWNIVTSLFPNEARNFGLDTPALHADRYRRAAEFVDVTIKLWDSWEDGALVGDKESGVFVETDLLHAIDHEGDFFRVAGPISLPRSPQGRPVLVQAGASEDGMNLAASCAELVFTAQPTLEDAQAFYRDMKSRVAGFDRDPAEVKVLPGYAAIIGSTEEEAQRREEELFELVQFEFSLKQLSHNLDTEITVDMLDKPLPPLEKSEEDIQGRKSRFSLIVNLARTENLTVRQLISRLAAARGHRQRTGTPEQIADELELWFRSGAADGFTLMPPTIPTQLELFIETVVPILQKRGLFREEYEGTTLREHYGLERPASIYSRV